MSLTQFKKYLTEKAGLSESIYQELVPLVETKTIDKGDILLTAGQICNYSFFVESGLLRSYTIDQQGKYHIIQFASENWIISDRSSIYFDEPSDFYIDAIEPTTVVFLNQHFISKACELSETYRIFNDRALQNHIRHLQKRINLLLGANAETRYLDFIQLYPDMLLRVPQWMIASYLGIMPESLSRVRKELAKRNFKP
jgi:CRP-like cAMP-binding protein